MHKSFPFWPFLHYRFSLSPHFARQSNGWVKIYNVKKVKTEMTCAPPKTCQNQKSFWIPSNQPPNTCRAGWANFFHQKHVFVKHPTVQSIYSLAYFLFLLFRVNPVFGPDIDGLVIWFAYMLRIFIIVKTPKPNSVKAALQSCAWFSTLKCVLCWNMDKSGLLYQRCI